MWITMFNKISKVLVSSLILLSLVGCKKKLPDTPIYKTESEASEAIFAMFQNNDLSQWELLANEEVASSLGREKISSTWQEATENAGAFQSLEIHVKEERADGLIYGLYHFENEILNVQFRLDDNFKIRHLWISTYPSTPENYEDDQIVEKDYRFGVGQGLNGKLTLPKGVENPPVVILLQGSGQTNMNEEVFAVKPFEDLAHGLARRGIASIRYDKRYYDFPNWSNPEDVSISWEYLYDVEAVIDGINDLPVDKEKIYLVGHSLGGMLSLRIAVENEEIEGVISLAGTPRGLEEVMRNQAEQALKDLNFSKEVIESELNKLDEEIEKILSLTEDSESSLILSIPTGYWLELNQSKGKDFLSQLTADLLILQGEEDFQVTMENDFAAWKKETAGMSTVMMKSYPGLNHMFMTSTSQSVADYQVENHVDEEVLDDLALWILRRKLNGDENE